MFAPRIWILLAVVVVVVSAALSNARVSNGAGHETRHRVCAGETLWTIAEDGTSLEGALNHGATPDVVERMSVPVAESVIGLVASTGVPTSILPGDPHNAAVDRATGTRTAGMAAAPVSVRGTLAGVLSAINSRRGAFDAADLDALAWKAYLMGLVLEDGVATDR